MSHYGVSERLQGMMCTEPVTRSPKSAGPPATPRTYTRSLDRSLHTEVDDIEGAYSVKDLAEDIDTSGALRNLSFAEVANQIWHFCSVDHGPRCTYHGLRSGIRADQNRYLYWVQLSICNPRCRQS